MRRSGRRPHEPAHTFADYAEADGITFRTAQLLRERHPELTFVHLPPLYVAADVLPHVGSVTFSPAAVMTVLTELGRTLCKQGFKHIWVASFHGGPRHFVAIEVAADKVNRKYGGRMLSMFGLLMNQLTGGSTDLSEVLGRHTSFATADLVGDTHGGAVETSLLLHLTGDHVRPVYGELERNTVDIELARHGEAPATIGAKPSLGALLRGFKHKLRFFEDYTYAGHPAISTPELGKATLDTLAGLSLEPLSQVYRGTLPPKKWRSPLWKMRWLFTVGWIYWLFDRIFGRKPNPTW
jgi:creatinine amidohydrolase/Fe(II)-dependent formamide hydrolase-like protein